MPSSALSDWDYFLQPVQIEAYQRNGFIQLDDVITGSDLERLRNSVTTLVEDDETMPINGGDRQGTYAQ